MAPARAEARPQLARLARLAAGWTLLVAGGALMVLPGPGIPLVLGGLALLARDRPWARRAHEALLRRWRTVRDRLRHRGTG